LLRLRNDCPTCFRFPAWRQENHAKSETSRKLNPDLPRTISDELLRNGSEQASSISTPSIRIHAATMRQADQRLKRAVNNLTRRRPANLGDKADTAGVVV
jgi:hypothetical protein